MKQRRSLFCYKFQTIHHFCKIALQSAVSICSEGKNKRAINQQKPRRLTSALRKQKRVKQVTRVPLVTNPSSPGWLPSAIPWPTPTKHTQPKVHEKEKQNAREPNNFYPRKGKAWNPSSLLGKDTIMRRKI